MKINARYVNQEPDYGSAAQPDSLGWELCVAGDRMIGEIYLPSGIYDAPHPAVVICHGIPGINCNDDLAQAQGTHAVQQKVILDTNHSLDTARFALAETVGQWLEKCVKQD